ncbi:MAG: hypothetical protein RIC55_15505 [Pirellulaceae bacterium]
MRPALLIIIFGSLATGLADRADAQASAEGPSRGAAMTPDNGQRAEVGTVSQSSLDVYYLPDENGRLVPVNKTLPYEKWLELFERYLLEKGDSGEVGSAASTRPPAYQLNQVKIDGRVVGKLADLRVEIVLTVLADGRVRVPLRLGNARLLDVPKVTGKADGYVDFDGDEHQHIFWAEGQAGEQCTIVMPMRTAVRQVGEVWEFVLSAPSAAMAKFTLRVPGSNLELVRGANLEIEPSSDATLFTSPVHGDLELAWRPAPAAGGKPAVVLSAETRMSIRFQGDAHAEANILLTVKSLRGPFEGFTLQLPPGMEVDTAKWHNVDDRRELRTQVRRPEAKRNPGQGDLVDVSFPVTSEVVVLDLKAVLRRSESAPAQAPVDLAGFAVVGAREDTGIIEVGIAPEWTVDFQTKGVYREKIPAETPSGDAVARFVYNRQPYSLRTTVRRRKTLVTVDPVYIAQVDPDRVSVEARLRYFVRGRLSDPLQVQLPGWIVDEVSADSSDGRAVIDRDNFDPSRTEPLAIPLMAPVNDFQLTILAHRNVAPDEEGLAFLLPRPVADTVTPAVVVISPAHNVQLTPNVEQMNALAVDLLPPQLSSLPLNRQAPLYFRDRGDDEPAEFLARYEIRPRVVTIAENSRLEFDDRRVGVQQMLTYNIANEPLSTITLRAPRMALTPDNLKATLDGDELTWSELAPSEPADGLPLRSKISVALPSARIGPCRLMLTYFLPLPVPTPGQTTAWSVPLVVPAREHATSFENRTARIYTKGDTVRVEPKGDSWNDDDSAPAEDGLTLVAEPDADELPLSISLLKSPRQATSVVGMGWVRTWLNGTVRQDRAVFRLSTNDKVVRLKLPAGARLETAAVDGRRVAHPLLVEDELSLEAPHGDPQRPFVVEVWYELDAEQSMGLGRTSLSLPQVAGADLARRFYWQLATPRDEHLWLPPSSLTPELTWRWHRLFGEFGYWDRQANLGQRQLEQLIGASQDAELPTGANQYLFSTFDLPRQVEFTTASRRAMLPLASALVLIGGLLLIYFPVLRHPAVLLIAGVAVAALALLYPEPAIQFAQAAVVGLAVLLAARLLNWAIVRQRDQRAVIRGTSLMGRDPNTTETRLPVEADSQMSTATAALAVHASAGESNG